jgi:hypothetical protein
VPRARDLQPPAAAEDGLPPVTRQRAGKARGRPTPRTARRAPARAPASARVRQEWQARIAAEYASAAVTQHLVLWLIQLGASPEVIDAGLRIVADELVHSRLSHEVYHEAGGTEPPLIDRATLELVRRPHRPLEHDVLRVVVRIFCLGETVAVPLFSHLRSRCTVRSARAALDRILRDEVRHRDFGWLALDWLLTTPLGPEVPALLDAELPGMFAELEESYGTGNPAHDDAATGAITDAEREWGLAPPREYADILHRTFTRDYQPRFAARGIDATPAWAARTH